jgi:hypothetical protein
MPTYVSLIQWTEQGIKNYKDTPNRAEDYSKLVEGTGGRVRELLWTVGEYDIVAVADFPTMRRERRARLPWPDRTASFMMKAWGLLTAAVRPKQRGATDANLALSAAIRRQAKGRPEQRARASAKARPAGHFSPSGCAYPPCGG